MAKHPVENYYDNNTRRFLKYGRGGEAAAIHREVWGPGTNCRQDAIEYVNTLVEQTLNSYLSPHKTNHILDLGCGVGGTTFWLAQKRTDNFTGISISEAQIELAQQTAWKNKDNRIKFLKADFLNLPEMEPVDAAFAIEAFLHADDGEKFFQHISSKLNKDGILIICDDFLAESSADTPKSIFWLKRFKKGWFANNLDTPQTAKQIAQKHGLELVEETNLSQYIKEYYRRWVLNILKWIFLIPVNFSFWKNLAGGTALQVCLINKWIEYHFLVFRKTST